MDIKTCTKCDEEKEISEFYKDNQKKTGISSSCKQCCDLQKLEYKHRNPWKKIFWSVKYRCENPKSRDYKTYGLRGIKCCITIDEIKELYFRDKAYLMEHPTIDRKDNDGDYIFNNCQFLENEENAAKDIRKIIIQFTKEGCFIREWKSIIEVERQLKINDGNISLCCKGKRTSAGGFIWKYKEI
jgi:hypothetical protein